MGGKKGPRSQENIGGGERGIVRKRGGLNRHLSRRLLETSAKKKKKPGIKSPIKTLRETKEVRNVAGRSRCVRLRGVEKKTQSKKATTQAGTRDTQDDDFRATREEE